MLPSLIEGFPNALVEAMAVGKAIVAADCTYGPDEIILKNNFNGILVSPFLSIEEDNNARLDEWSTALLSVINDNAFQKTLGENARQRASDFSAEAIGYKWIDLVESITSA
jgi:glycosyltransferase involved in cell wall biosynthesis